MLRRLSRIGRWLRVRPEVRWWWPTPALVARRRSEGTGEQPAAVHARRLTDPAGDDVEIRNDSAGEALDVIVQVYVADSPDGVLLREGGVDFLGAHTTYVVGLRAAEATEAAPPSGYWVHVRWLNRDGSKGGSWSLRPAGAGALALEPASDPWR